MPKFKSIAKMAAFACASIPVRLIGCFYWGLVRVVLQLWSRRALHALSVGSFVAGSDKRRSFYRDEMILKTFALAVRTQRRSCLDLGCNDGYWSFRLARFGLAHVTGIDASYEEIARANMLKHVYSYSDFIFKNGDMLNISQQYNERTYDVVLLLSVLYHLPDTTDWDAFFKSIAKRNTETLVIDSRWFENDAYWSETSSDQAVIVDHGKMIKKWRPLRREVIAILYRNGYQHVLEINPTPFLEQIEEARGDGNPYSLQNVADYVTGNRSLLVAYKEATDVPKLAESIGVPMPK